MRAYVVGLFVAGLASVLLAAGEGSVAIDGLVGGFWTTISGSLGFMGLNTKAGGPLLDSLLLGGMAPE